MNKNIVEDGRGTRFGSGQDCTRGGRPRNTFKELRRKGFSSDDIKRAFLELAFCNMSELREVKEDESKPAILRIIANQFIMGLKKVVLDVYFTSRPHGKRGPVGKNDTSR